MLDKLSFGKLTDKERRLLQVGAICALAILAAAVVPKWWSRWSRVRTDIKVMQAMLEEASAGQLNPPGLAGMVPVFEMPQDPEKQKFLFRDKVDEQLKQAGLPSSPLQLEPLGKRRVGEFNRLSLKYKGTCRFEQLVDFLVRLKENPYYAGVEEVILRADAKKPPQERQDVEVEVTISTFVKADSKKAPPERPP